MITQTTNINYFKDGYGNIINIEIMLSEQVKIPGQVINKALMIAMNYLLENLETTDQESAN
jgi:hypothetical protein